MNKLLALAVLIMTKSYAQNVADPAFIDVAGLLRSNFESDTMCLKRFDPNFCKKITKTCKFESNVLGENAKAILKLKSKPDWSAGSIELQLSSIHGEQEANTLYPATMLDRTDVKLQSLKSISVDGSFVEKKVQVSDGTIKITDSELKKKFGPLSESIVKGEGNCDFITRETHGLSFPIYDSPGKKELLGEMLLTDVERASQVSFKNKDGVKEGFVASELKNNCPDNNEGAFYLMVLDSVQGLHNLGKGPWGPNGWIDAPVVKLTSHKFEKQFQFTHREYVEFKLSKVKGKITVISHEGEPKSEEVEATSLWQGQKFLPTFMCP